MKMTLIRHTSLQVPTGICYGQSDIDVALSFQDEIRQLNEKLNGIHFDAVYASPLQRCSKLALALNKGDVQYEERLKELHFGDWEMQAWDDIPRDVFDIWAHNYAEVAPPNGETFTQLQQRTLCFLEEMSQKHAGQQIAVVTHGGVIRAYLAHVLDMPLKGLFRFHVDYASITQLEFGQAVPKITFVNR
jgi:alpha-ribazole phosphatase